MIAADITPATPWYATHVAYGIYMLVAVVVAAVMVILSRRKMSRQYRRRLAELRMQREKDVFESKSRFFVNLVHEIRTPLTLISIPLEQMEQELRSGNADVAHLGAHTSSMRRNVDYLLGMVSQLLDFRRVSDGSDLRLHYSTIDVGVRLAQIVERFEHPMRVAGKDISLHLPEKSFLATVDADKLDRVVMNLLGNAEKYSTAHVQVSLKAPDADGYFSIMVSDDGPGVPASERSRIFDAYYQIKDDSMSAAMGTGLGLAYAKLVAVTHNGSIRVEENDAMEHGARFVVTLPVESSADTARSSAEDVARHVVADAPEDSVTVLVVDDYAELLVTVADALGRSYDVVTASSGEEAWEILQRRSDIDVIVSDFMMPGISGAELCRRVKSDDRLSHIPFIILTAKTDTDSKVEGMECGADVYIEKPFSVRQLQLQIANMLRNRVLYLARMEGKAPQKLPASAPEAAGSLPLAGEGAEGHLNRQDAEFLNTLNEFIRSNISEENFSIDVMSSRMNMSRSSFYRKLKAVSGLTPVDYLKNFRLDYAAGLLVEGVRVTEVAVLAGFTSSSYFAKCFKTRFGVIPKEYVARHNGANPSAHLPDIAVEPGQ